MPRDLCPHHDIRIIQRGNSHAHILLTMRALETLALENLKQVSAQRQL